MPNPGDYKPCSAEEVKAYKRMILAKNIAKLKKINCPECRNVGTLKFTGELLDLDAAFVLCTHCDYSTWVLLKGTGLPSEVCRFELNGLCTRTNGKCIFIESDMRKCSLFKEAISASHRARILLARGPETEQS